MNNKIENFKKSRLGLVPADWEIVRFKEICTVHQGLQVAIKDRYENPAEDRQIYLTVQYLNSDNKIKDSVYVKTTNDKVICDEEDVLMTRTGNTGLVVTGVSGVFHNNFFIINYDKDKIDKKFLVYLLNTERIQHLILTLGVCRTNRL